MIKRILVPLDPSPYTKSAIELGCLIAKKNDAELTGLVVLDTPGISNASGPSSIGGGYYAKELKTIRKKDAEERIHQLLTEFKQKCEKEGVACNNAEFQGSPSKEIIRQSIYYDLVMIGIRTFFHFETHDTPGDTLTKILDHAITPIYAVPESISIPKHSEEEQIKVLIAFDGSLLAARALQKFAQLAFSRKFEVIIITSNKDETIAKYHLEQANSYLQSHGITNVKTVHTNKNIISVIDKDYLNWADYFVVGAHAKVGIIDFMVGSLTKHLIKIDKKPVLIG